MNGERQSLLFGSSAQVPKTPVLISTCFLGIPCRWHGRRSKRRDALIARLQRHFVLVPVCPEQLGGFPTPRSGAYLKGTGAQVLDAGLRFTDERTGEDLTDRSVAGSRHVLELARIVGARRAYLKGGSPCCDRDGITGEILRRGGVEVVRVP